MRKYPPVRQSTLPAILALAVAHSGQAETQLEEIVVTAQKREQRLLEVPLSIRTIDAETASTDDLGSLSELASNVPGLNINSGASQPNLFVRGVGSGLNAGFEQSIGIYVDDIYLSRAQFVRAPLGVDIESVEFIYGPQGALLGKNTVAGAVNIRSQRPSPEMEGYVTVLYEPEQNEQSVNAALSGPISDSVSGRLSLRQHTLEGWWDNLSLDEKGPDLDNQYFRGQIEWTGDSQLTALIRYDHGDLQTLNSPFVVYQSGVEVNFQGQNPFPVVSEGEAGADDLATSDRTQTDIGSLRIEKEFDGFSFSAITGYAAYDTARVESVDFSSTPAIHRTKDEEFSQWSQEFRVSSNNDADIQWLAGLYYHDQSLRAVRRSTETDFLLLGDLSTPAIIETDGGYTESLFDQDARNISAFGQVDLSLGEFWTISAGLRYSYDRKGADKRQISVGGLARLVTPTFDLPEALVFTDAEGILIDELRSHDFPNLHLSENDLGWNATLSWEKDDMLIYGSANRAYKSGGFDEAYGGPDQFVQMGDTLTGAPVGEPIATGISEGTVFYDGEDVLSLEIGAKWKFSSSGELYASIFHANYENLQTSALDVDQFVVVNAAEAISQGLELGARWRFHKNWTINASASFLDAYWESFSNAPCTVVQTVSPSQNPGCQDINGQQITDSSLAIGQDLGGETLLFAPDVSANMTLNYVTRIGQELAFYGRLSAKYRDEYYSSLDLDPHTVHDASTRLNLTFGIASILDNWRVSVIGKNLTDERSTVVNGDIPTTASGSYFAIPERPRSIAIQLHYAF